MGRAVGIDLGTTNSVVAVCEPGRTVIIPNRESERVTPSIVRFEDDGRVVVGVNAKRQMVVDPQRTVKSVKRHMGRDWSFQVEQGGVVNTYLPQEVSARIISKLVDDASAYLGETVTQAVITVPAYFDDAQRQATLEAGKIAGVEVLRILNEPTAAALAYGLDRSEQEKTVLVFDLGGGTLDVSILKVGGGVFEVLATVGNTSLGGDNFDEVLYNWLNREFIREHGVELDDISAQQRLLEASENCKKELSANEETLVTLPFLLHGEAGPMHFERKVTRSMFEQMTQDLLDQCRVPLERALLDVGVGENDLDEVLLVGGGTRMPGVVNLVEQLTRVKATSGFSPDEIVGEGAAVQAGVLRGDIQDVLLLDVLPLSLGVETKGGIFARMIERNTTIPTRRSEIFTTTKDRQEAVDIHVLQGESEMCDHNLTVGRFGFDQVTKASRGVPQVEVTFDVDADGIVRVEAKDLVSGTSMSVSVGETNALSEQEVERMHNLALEHASEDRKRRELVELQNRTDAYLYSSRRLLDAHPLHQSSGVGVRLEESRRRAEKLLELNDLGLLEEACTELMHASQDFDAWVQEHTEADTSSYLQRAESVET